MGNWVTMKCIAKEVPQGNKEKDNFLMKKIEIQIIDYSKR